MPLKMSHAAEAGFRVKPNPSWLRQACCSCSQLQAQGVNSSNDAATALTDPRLQAQGVNPSDSTAKALAVPQLQAQGINFRHTAATALAELQMCHICYDTDC